MINFTTDQIFLVTGASSGLGQGVALLLNKLGATVVGIGRNTERLNQTRNSAAHPDRFFIEEKDVTDDIDGLPEYIKSLKEKYGKFRGLAICHGITKCAGAQMITYDSIKQVFDCDYFAPMMLAKGFADRRNNTGRGAAIVAISSYAANACNRGMIEYSGAKAALRASIKSLARELSPYGIRANTVSPSDIKTPMVLCNEFSTVRGTERGKKYYPLGYGEVEHAANLIAYMMSDAAKWITAQDYIVDCGVGL